MNGTSGLILEGVSAGYGDTVVLEGISLALAPGETLAVLGRNGVGKTTLLATIMGHTTIAWRRYPLRRPGNRRAAGLPAGAARHRFCPTQEREIFPSLTVEENLTVAQRPGQWTLAALYDFFSRPSPSAAAITAISYRAANSRCWRSAVR